MNRTAFTAPPTSGPRATDAEHGIIGAVLLHPDLAGDAARLPADWFLDEQARAAFVGLLKLHRANLPINSTLLLRELHDKPPFDRQVSAAEYLYRCPHFAVGPTLFQYHVRDVLEAARKRRIADVAAAAHEAAMNGKSSRSVLNDALAAMDDLRRDLEPDSQTAERMFDRWAQGVIDRERPALFDVAPPESELNSFPVGENVVTLLGAPPGWGKTLLVMQMIFDALELPEQEHLRALIANVEMPAQALLDRQLARLTGVGYSHIQNRTFDPAATPRLQAGIGRLRALMPRVSFLSPPFVLERLAESAVTNEANIVVLDYAQRFDTQTGATDQRAKANAVMDFARSIASEGRAVIVVSALNRPQTKSGKYDHASMGLASFRESSELEYGCDCAYLLIREDEDKPEAVLKCVKNRSGERKDIQLKFDGRNMQFLDAPLAQEWTP